MKDYAVVLERIYGAPNLIAGHTELRPWLWPLWPSPFGNALLTVVLAVGLALPAVLALSPPRTLEPSNPGPLEPSLERDRDFELLAFAGVVSLLSLRHLSSDFVLLVPLVVAWRSGPFSQTPARNAPRWGFAITAALLVAAVPSLARALVRRGAPEEVLLLTILDRLLCLALWTWLAARLVARHRPSPTAVPTLTDSSMLLR
jgi:hypothetical protein